MFAKLLLPSATMFALLGCGAGPEPGWDGGLSDAGADVALDATREDIGPEDASAGDAGPDTGAEDASLEDGGGDANEDSGSEDAASDVPLRLGPPYPIVFAHGFFGFDDFAGADFLRYFYQVQENLAEHGEEVFMTTVDPFSDSTMRGEALASQVQQILRETGYEKVVIIAHSQGGVDARYVAHHYSENVAAVLTISTPHRGTRAADVLLRVVEDERLRDLADDFVRLIARPLWDAAGEETSVFDALRQLSSSGMEEFNERTPDSPEVAYYSVAGRTDHHYGLLACRSDGRSPEFVSRWSAYQDAVDPLLAISEAVIDGGLIDTKPNDGLVRVEDAKHGRFLGCIPADHLDEIGHLLGDRAGLLNPFDHQAFYRGAVEFLRSEGF